MKSKPQPSRTSKPAPQESQQPVPSPQEKPAQALAERDRWLRIAASPSLSPKAAAWAASVARSYQAAAQLGQKALDYRQERDQNLQKVLLITPSPPAPPPVSEQGNPPSSTRPETSA